MTSAVVVLYEIKTRELDVDVKVVVVVVKIVSVQDTM